MNGLLDNLPLPLLITAEILFVGLVVFVAWVGVLRRQVQVLTETNEEQESLIKQLQAQLAQTKADASEAGKVVDEGADVSDQRIKNLERFRKLYFELDDRLNQELDNAKEQEKRLAELQQLLDKQTEAITTLKDTISEITEKYSLEQDVRSQLEASVHFLEGTTESLKLELEAANRQATKTAVLEKELEHYKERVDQMEKSEIALKNEANIYRKELDEIRNKIHGSSPHGTVKIAEIQELETNLSKKEREINQLRTECETIAQQYEDLAASSLKKIEEMERTSREEQVNLEQLQAILDQSAKALAEKNKEIEQLEKRINKLGTNVSAEEEQLFLNSLAEKAELESTFFEAADKAMEIAGGDETEQAGKLKESLRAKQNELSSGRDESQQIREQTKILMQEKGKLQTSVDELKNENLSLRNEVARLKGQSTQLIAKDEEILSLRKELQALEEKYLRLVDRQS